MQDARILDKVLNPHFPRFRFKATEAIPLTYKLRSSTIEWLTVDDFRHEGGEIKINLSFPNDYGGHDTAYLGNRHFPRLIDVKFERGDLVRFFFTCEVQSW